MIRKSLLVLRPSHLSFELKKRNLSEVMARRIVLGVAIGWGYLVGPSAVAAATTETVKYDVSDGQFSFFSGEVWELESGSLRISLVGESTLIGGFNDAVYRIESFNLLATDSSGTSRTILAIPDGIGGVYADSRFPDELFDIGVMNLHPDSGVIDFLVYDLSVDGMPVDASNTIGGPSFVGSNWEGDFPIPTNFTVSALVDLGSIGLSGESTVSATVPEPSSVVLLALSALGIVRRNR